MLELIQERIISARVLLEQCCEVVDDEELKEEIKEWLREE